MEHFRPADPDPQASVLGTHRDHSEALNIPNPEPGMHYWHCARTQDQVMSAINRGWQVSHRAERLSETDLARGLPLDTTVSRQDVILLEIDDENYRKFKARKLEAQRRKSIEGATEDYLSHNANVARYAGTGRAVYYKAPGHAVDYESQPITKR